MPTFLWIHSPLVGPLTWRPVAAQIRQRGMDAVIPVLRMEKEDEQPYWKQHIRQVVTAIEAIEQEQPVILVAHSGAGVLLPEIGRALRGPVAAYLFVDALIPSHMRSRLDLIADYESEGAAAVFRQAAVDGYLPVWKDEDLHDVIPDVALRQRFVAELRPLPLAVYEEPIPVVEGWPDAPCGYLHFSPPYDRFAGKAQEAGWYYERLRAGHFHMLADPHRVADTILSLLLRMDVA